MRGLAVAQEDWLLTHQVGQLGDQVFGREIRTRRRSRTARLAAAAAHAGIEIEPLLPCEVSQAGDAQLWCVTLNLCLHIGDRRKGTLGLQIPKKGVNWCVEQMLEFGERDAGNEGKGDDHMAEPEHGVDAKGGRGTTAQANGPKQAGTGIPYIRAAGPWLIIDYGRTDGLIGQAQAFKHVSRQCKIEQREQNPQVGAPVIESGWPAAVAPPCRPAQAGEKDQPHRVKNELIALIEGPDKNLAGIGANQWQGEILFNGNNVGANKEGQKSEEDQGMHHTWSAITQHTLLTEHLCQRLAQAGRQVRNAPVRTTAAPALDVSQDTAGHDRHGKNGGKIE